VTEYIENDQPATLLLLTWYTKIAVRRQMFLGENDNSTWDDWNLDNHDFEGNRTERKGPKSQPTEGKPWGFKFLVRTGNQFSGECDQFDGFGRRASSV